MCYMNKFEHDLIIYFFLRIVFIIFSRLTKVSGLLGVRLLWRLQHRPLQRHFMCDAQKCVSVKKHRDVDAA